MKLEFEHNYQERYLIIRFSEPVVLKSEDDILALREQWMANLKSWHSPYKALIDGKGLSFDVANTDRERFLKAFERTYKLLSGLFLRKAVAFNLDQAISGELLPFEVLPSEDEAREALKLKHRQKSDGPLSFRESLQFQNHFRQHVMELAFSQAVTIDSKEQVLTLKDKLTNNLMQWHSAWNLMVDCSNLEVHPDQFPAFEEMFRFFHGFFLKKVIGYSPKQRDLKYPFEVVRVRHIAAARLESEGLFSGDDANCQSRRS